MPLTWLGQLGPTMQQQLALQKALLALAREAETTRAVETARAPALVRGLGAAPVGGFMEEQKQLEAERAQREHEKELLAMTLEAQFPKTKPSSLAQALAPTTEYVSPEEKRAAEKENLVTAASEFWTRIEPLDDASEKVALNACKRYQPLLYRAMIEQGYVDKTTGMAVRKEVVKKPMSRDTHVEDGWLYEDILYDDGTSTHEIIGRAPVEAETGLTVEQAMKMEELGMKKVEFSERHHKQIIDTLGPMPKVGIDEVEEKGKMIPVEPRHVSAWLEGYAMLDALLYGQEGVSPEGEATMSQAQKEFEGSTGAVKMAVQQKLGVPQTGVWDEATEFAFETYGEVLLGEKPTGEKAKETKPKAKGYTPEMLARQEEFWNKWASVFKISEAGLKAIKSLLKGEI